MERNKFIAKAEVTIDVAAAIVWDALINPAMIKKYMFGTTVTSDWTEHSKITWKGEWRGKPYEDKGEILKVIPNEKLQYTHYSPLSSLDDKEENYHMVTIDLKEIGRQTVVTLMQDKNASEEARQHSEKNGQ